MKERTDPNSFPPLIPHVGLSVNANAQFDIYSIITLLIGGVSQCLTDKDKLHCHCDVVTKK